MGLGAGFRVDGVVNPEPIEDCSHVNARCEQNPQLGAQVIHRSTVKATKAKFDFQQEMWLPGALTPFASGA